MILSNDRVSWHVPKLNYAHRQMFTHTSDLITHTTLTHVLHHARCMHALIRRTLTNYSFTCKFIRRRESPLYLGLLVVVLTMPLMVTTLVSLSRPVFAHCHQLVHFTITGQVTDSRSAVCHHTTHLIPLADARLIKTVTLPPPPLLCCCQI